MTMACLMSFYLAGFLTFFWRCDARRINAVLVETSVELLQEELVIETHLVAELPVSIRCKERLSDHGNSSEIFHSCQSIFLIVYSQSS